MSILKFVGVGLLGAGCVVSALMYRESSSNSCCSLSGASMGGASISGASQGCMVAVDAAGSCCDSGAQGCGSCASGDAACGAQCSSSGNQCPSSGNQAPASEASDSKVEVDTIDPAAVVPAVDASPASLETIGEGLASKDD